MSKLDLTSHEIYKAILLNDIDWVRKLAKSPYVYLLRDWEGNNILHVTIEKSTHQILSILIEAGIEYHNLSSFLTETGMDNLLSTKNTKQVSPLMCAAKCNNVKCVLELIKYAKNFSDSSKECKLLLVDYVDVGRAFEIAIQNDYIECVKILADYICNIETYFLISARKGKIHSMKFLIERGANVNKVSYNLYSPLWYSVNNEHIGCVRLLLDSGADPNCSHKKKPINAAIDSFNQKITLMLIDSGADPLDDSAIGDLYRFNADFREKIKNSYIRQFRIKFARILEINKNIDYGTILRINSLLSSYQIKPKKRPIPIYIGYYQFSSSYE